MAQLYVQYGPSLDATYYAAFQSLRHLPYSQQHSPNWNAALAREWLARGFGAEYRLRHGQDSDAAFEWLIERLDDKPTLSAENIFAQLQRTPDYTLQDHLAQADQANFTSGYDSPRGISSTLYFPPELDPTYLDPKQVPPDAPPAQLQLPGDVSLPMRESLFGGRPIPPGCSLRDFTLGMRRGNCP